MELTPQAVSEAEFREAKRGGYNIRDVDEFLDRVSVGVGQMQEHIREAYQRAETAENRLVELQRQLEEAQRRGPDGPGGGDTEDTLRRTLVLAQRTADATIKEAKEEAERLVTEARDEASSSRAAAEAEIREGMATARQEAEAEVQQLVATRQELADEITSLERHLEGQREQVRASVEELQRLLDDPSTLRTEPAPPLAPIPDLPSNGAASPLAPFPPDSERAWGGTTSQDTAPPDGSIPPSEGAGPSPDRPPLPSRSPGKRGEQREPSPQAEGAGSEPSGFRPDLAPSFDPSEDREPRQRVPGEDDDDDDDDLSLPIDAPPPPPPPPGLDHVNNVGGIPIEPGSRPSEWGKGVFDTEQDDEPKGTRFGRRR